MIVAALKISGGLRFAQPNQRPFHVSPGVLKEDELLRLKAPAFFPEKFANEKLRKAKAYRQETAGTLMIRKDTATFHDGRQLDVHFAVSPGAPCLPHEEYRSLRMQGLREA
jgi:hypothetical protein